MAHEKRISKIKESNTSLAISKATLEEHFYNSDHGNQVQFHL